MRRQLVATATAGLLGAGTAGAQIPAQRLTATETGIGAAVVMARRTFVGGEASLAYRPGGQGRIALALGGGAEADAAAGRAQLSAQFLMSPGARRGVGLYAGFGTALAVRRGGRGAAFIALLLGLEGSPGLGDSWYVELGIGGGVRAAAGWRVRRFPAWWPV